MSTWPQLGDEMRAARGVVVGGARERQNEPRPDGLFGVGRAHVGTGLSRRARHTDVNEILRLAAEERGHRNREYELPFSALFGRRR